MGCYEMVNQHKVEQEVSVRCKRVCMLAYTTYECDNRVRRYAEALVKRGDTVDVIALSSSGFGQMAEPAVNGVRVYRVQHREQNERSMWSYAFRLLCFLVRSSRELTRQHKQIHYDVIHVHNMPDFLIFAAWYPKLTGSTIILDIHDLVPELFANKFQSKLKPLYVWFLKAIEKMSARVADHVIISNDLWYETVTARSIERQHCSVLINHVDEDLFYRHAKTRTDDRFIILFPGSLQWHQGLDIAISAFAEIKRNVPTAEFHIYAGSGGNQAVSLRILVESLHLEESVKFYEGVSLDEVVQVIANADLGVVPKRADSFGNEAYSTKIMEFMSQGVPVVVSRTKIDSFYFEEGDVHFFPSGDSRAMAAAMLEVINDKELRESLISRGYDYCRHNGWARKKQEYLDLVDSLSTDLFDDIDPAVLAKPPFGENSNERRVVEEVAAGFGGTETSELDGPGSGASLEEN